MKTDIRAKIFFGLLFCGSSLFLSAEFVPEKEVPKPKKAGIHVENLMTHEEYKKAGLEKLTDSEIEALNTWFQSYAIRIAKAVNATHEEKQTTVVETYISGEFQGWEGETIWKMDNGQIWQQASYSYHYAYAYHPEVTIYYTAGGWKMKVEDESETVDVKRIK